MANCKSAEKRIKVIARETEKNRSRMAALRTNLKTAKAESDKLAAEKLAYSEIDKAVAKGLIHKNTAARKKAKFAAASKAE